MATPVYTDDPIYGLPARWYGPGGAWTGVRYPAVLLVLATTVAVTAVVMVVAVAVMTIVKLLVGLAVGFAVGVVLARRIFPHVDEWMPLFAHVETWVDELFTPRRPTGGVGTTTDLRTIT